MFLRTAYTTLAILLLAVQTQAQESPSSGITCFQKALVEARAGANLQEVLRRYISVPDIARRAAWRKWRIRWGNLNDEQKQRLLKAVESTLTKFERKMFYNIDLGSFALKETRTRYGYKLWGSYRTRTDGSLDRFELGIATPSCMVVRFVWNNIALSDYVARTITIADQ